MAAPKILRYLNSRVMMPDDVEDMNRRLVDKLVTLQGTFAAALARSPARFNPVREYLANRRDYPTA